jgi:hypothetical protein
MTSDTAICGARSAFGHASARPRLLPVSSALARPCPANMDPASRRCDPLRMRRISSRSVPIVSVFRPGDPDAITVLRLQAAVNDLGSLLRMVLYKQGSPAEINATYRYAVRMAAVHIESIKLLVRKDLPRLARRHFWRRGWEDAKAKAGELQKLIDDKRLLQVLAIVRHKFGGHYDSEYFVRALKLVDRGDLMELPGRGVHFNVCDILFDQVIAHESHSAYKLDDIDASVEAALNALMGVQQALLPAVTSLVFALYYEAEGK